MIWDLPGGHTYVTSPGSALLFPTLCTPTGDAPVLDRIGTDRCGDRTAMMPLRKTTRPLNRAHRVAVERGHNRDARQSRETYRPAIRLTEQGPPPADDDDDPPPF